MATRILQVTWARGAQAWTPQWTPSDVGNGTASEVIAYDDSGSVKHLSWTGPLPDLVLAPLSTIRLMVGYTGGSNGAIAVSANVVTLSQQLAASIVQTPEVTPLFVPLPVEDIQPSP